MRTSPLDMIVTSRMELITPESDSKPELVGSKKRESVVKSAKKTDMVVTRFVHYRELKTGTNRGRVVTVCYEYNREQKVLKYGAAFCRLEKPSDYYNRKAHNQTAEGRMKKFPVIINNFEDDDKLDKFHEKIRSLLYKNGVKAKPEPVATE